MFIVILILTIACWFGLWRRRPLTTLSLVSLWALLATFLGVYFYIADGLDLGSWRITVEPFAVAGLLVSFPILFLIGFVELSRRVATRSVRGAVRIGYALAVIALFPVLKGVVQQIGNGNYANSSAVVQTLAYSAYAMLVVAIVMIVLGLVAVIRERDGT
jgi:hypothetical protein